MLLDDIKKANIQAMKDKDSQARNILGILLNKIKLAEIAKRGQADTAMTDAEITAILQKTVKELNEEMDGYKKAGYTERVADIQKQMDVTKGFLPQMLSEKEIKDIIATLEDKSLPSVMKHFKANYNGKCDMTLVKSCCE